ncbi:TPA: 2-oxo-tetronate isomerase [Salmonella enterica subsp. houtenae]|nr:2-oxo-tetronate isomerase [Salmonella enterica subsp. houtenae serovar 40:z4,z24:-]HBZ8548190.1 2-oxo-tetronate isomerase [Salmonella enterica subsp. houtenae]
MRLDQHDIVILDEAVSIDSLTQKLGELLVNQKRHLTTAESCTGGKLASALCAAEDTPSFYGVGYVTFTDETKAKILRVQRNTLAEHTAVSEAVVTEMAQGAKDQAEVDISMAISGYGGPEGGEDGTPAGTVWFAWNINNTTFTTRQQFTGDCQEVLDKCVQFALAELLLLLTKKA